MRDAPMMAMADWLSGIGLSKYFTVFADNGIGPDVLADLTEADLASLGVLLGDRKRLLRALAALRREQGEGPAEEPREQRRSHLTVLFCDLVGSTSLSHRLDPEDLDRVIREFQAACSRSIVRYRGYIARYMGDGILAYFGYPQAHEEDAQSAARAALDIVARIRGLHTPDGEPLGVRVGIATGLVLLAGEVVGSGVSREQTVVGKTPNLAARLQALAEPDTVLVSDATHGLLGEAAFHCRDLGLHQVRGLDDPVRVWRVLGERRSTSRFDATRARNLTGFVGRQAEVEQLLVLWRQACSGSGQTVLLTGEAGIGKSRLCRALIDLAQPAARILLRYQCSAHHAHSPLHPVIGQLEQTARFEGDDTPDIRLDKLEALLAAAGADVPACLPLFAALLAVPASHRCPLPPLAPQHLRRRTIDALVAYIARLAAQGPVLLVMEDLHWIDPTTQELLVQVLDRARALPVMVVMSARPEYEAPADATGRLQRIPVGRLENAHVMAMIESVAAGRSLPPMVCRQIIARTDGVPLFVEELTKSVIESGVLQEAADGYVWAGASPAQAIPATLQETLLARLDRLDSARDVAQVAAALGREFPFRLLHAVTGMPADALAARLAELAVADLIHGQGEPPDSHYAFKHSLVQGAAYETLLRARRVGLHARIADVLQHQFEDVARMQPEAVAHHLTQAQLPAQAVRWWQRAGQARLLGSANAEAVADFGRCLALLAELPGDAARDRQELDVRIALGVALMGTFGYTSPEFHANTDRALELCERLHASEEIFPVLWSQVARSFSSGDVTRAVPLARRFLDAAERQDRRQLRMVGHRLCGMTLFGAGQLQAARSHLEQSLSLYDGSSDLPLSYVYGADQRVAALAYLGRVLLLLGDAPQGLQMAEQALREATAVGHANSILYAEGCLLELHLARRAPLDVRAKAADVSRLAQEHAARNYQLVAVAAEGIGALLEGAGGATLDGIDRALSELTELNWIYWVTRLGLLAAEAGAASGNVGWARQWLDRVRPLVDDLGQGVCAPELRQVEAELLLAEGSGAQQAATLLQQAAEMAAMQGAHGSESRARVRLAELQSRARH